MESRFRLWAYKTDRRHILSAALVPLIKCIHNHEAAILNPPGAKDKRRYWGWEGGKVSYGRFLGKAQ